MENPVEPLARLSLAPMMDVTTREFRKIMSLLAPDWQRFTEMYSAGAILYGKGAEMLAHDEPIAPVLQLGGSDPEQMADAAAAAAAQGYTHINVNAGCPSSKVQDGNFGVCLMRDPERVGRIVQKIKDVARITVTVKHRLGIDAFNRPALLQFVECIRNAGADGAIMHARVALSGKISTKANRSIPPLDYPAVYELKERHSGWPVILNGGLQNRAQIMQELKKVDGAMLGRALRDNPLLAPALSGINGEMALRKNWPHILSYLQRRRQAGRPEGILIRSLMELRNGRPGARVWRRTLSSAKIPFNERLAVAWQGQQRLFLEHEEEPALHPALRL